MPDETIARRITVRILTVPSKSSVTMSEFKDSTHCQKCRQDIWHIAKSGRYLERTNPKGEKFKGECAPACEYHEIKPQEGSALINALNDQGA